MSHYIEVHMISNRPRLDEFINMWNNVKISDKVVIRVLTMDFPEKKFYLGNGIKVKYIRQKTFARTTFANHAWARNELLCYANSEYILFFDDWQRPHRDILMEHLHYLNRDYAVCGRRLECDKDGNNCKEDGRLGNGNTIICDYGQFWTCNASAKLDDILKVNGFDNRYNGGSAGEDYDMGMRIARLGTKMIYDPNAIGYHHCHDHLGRIGNPSCIHSHNTSAYKYLPEYGHFGNWNLMTSDDFELWWEGPIKYYKCKKCGIIGILDSIQAYYYNRDHNVVGIENGLEQVREYLKKKA